MSTPITPQSIVARAGDAVAAPLGDELMMMSVERGAYFGLNAVGAAIWQQLAAPIAVADLCAALLAEFEVTPEECAAEVSTFLERLRAEGLLRVVG